MCGKGIFQQKCCAGINAWEYGNKTTRDFWYACLDRSMGASNVTMTIANYDVKI
jgi:hypothetical protein